MLTNGLSARAVAPAAAFSLLKVKALLIGDGCSASLAKGVEVVPLALGCAGVATCVEAGGFAFFGGILTGAVADSGDLSS